MEFLGSKKLKIILGCVFVICVVATVGLVNAEEENPDMATYIPHKPNLVFAYCYSCGYYKAFEDYVNIIMRRYPQMVVTGLNYKPSGINMYLSKIIFMLKVLLIVLIVSSYNLFQALGYQTPLWWRSILSNKFYACLMIFFVGNLIESQLVATGAFEITLNDMPVWSKLQTGRLPSPQELFQIIDNQMRFVDKVQVNPEFVK